MIIFFTASLSGKKLYLENYKKIVSVLEKLGHKVISEHIFKKSRLEVEKESWKERQKYQKKFHQWISESDLTVGEISYPSTGTGYQMTQAIEKGKPVLALYEEEKIPVAFIGEPIDKCILAPYNLNSIEKELPILLRDATNQMDVRFNFFISPRIGAYLDWISKNQKTPRAVYLRKLIEEDMAKGDYEQKEVKNKVKKKK